MNGTGPLAVDWGSVGSWFVGVFVLVAVLVIVVAFIVALLVDRSGR